MRRTFALVAVTVGLITAGLWWTRAGAARTDGAPAPVEASPIDRPAAPVAVRPLPPASPGRPLFDPVVVGPCNLAPQFEQEISSQVEGLLKAVPVDLGQRVSAGDVLASLDDRLLQPQVELLRIKANSETAQSIARAQLSDVEKKLETAKALVAKRALPREEYHALLCQRERFIEELKRAQEDQEMARHELAKTLHTLDLHHVRTTMAGEVTKVYKRSGESVRQAEPLFSVAGLDRLRVEGLCKLPQAALLKPGMRAAVEPDLRGEPMTALSGHTATITALAVSADGRLLASASEDGTVRLWSCPQMSSLAVLRHPAEVHALAFAPAAAPGTYRLITGSADGQVRLWTVGGSTAEPVVWQGGHEAAVRAIAVSRDGRLIATGGEDRRIGLWDAATGKLLYWVHTSEDGLEVAHRGAVTTVQFAPDGHLISAGRDNTLKVWKLNPVAAAQANVLPGRTGDAAQLGLSPDGRRVLFDHGEELRVLDWADGSSQGTLRSRRQGRFQAFAAFSPTGRLILTAGNNGQVQLWTAPAPAAAVQFFRQGYANGFRRDSLAPFAGLAPQLWPLDGYELRHFAAGSPAAVTCGAFAPDEGVVYTAGADRLIHVWAVPAAAQWQQPLEAVVTYVGSQVERGTDLVRVRAELNNPTDPARRLRPGTYANLRVYPETAPPQ